MGTLELFLHCDNIFSSSYIFFGGANISVKKILRPIRSLFTLFTLFSHTIIITVQYIQSPQHYASLCSIVQVSVKHLETRLERQPHITFLTLISGVATFLRFEAGVLTHMAPALQQAAT